MNKAAKLLSVFTFIISLNAMAQDPNFHIYLCFGQSNMEGQGAIGSEDKTVDDRFQVYQTVDCSNLSRESNTWYPAIPPLSRCWNGLGPADYFGRTLVDELPSHIKVGVINVAIGGCRIELFDKDIYEDYKDTYEEDWFQDAIASYGGNPYQHLITLAKEAQEVGVIKGILLHQGESNTGDQQWPDKVKKIYDDMLEDLGLEANSLPLLAGEMVHEDQGGICASMNAIVAKLPDVLSTAHIISSSGCTDKDDNIHFDAAGYRELGKRYAETMLTLLDYDENAPVLAAPSSNHGYSIASIYPNPSIDSARIKFVLPEQGEVNLKIYTMSGREVMTIKKELYEPGEHEIQHDLSPLDSGLYFYSLKINGYTLTQRLLIE